MRTQSKPFSLGERAQPGAPSTGRPCAEPISRRLPGSTGIPKCSIRPPIVSTAAGITSRRSAIADAPNTMTSSAPAASSSSMAAANARCSCATRRSAIIVAPAGARRSCVTFSVFSMTFGASPGSRVETTPTFLMRYGATRRRGAAFSATARAASRLVVATAKGMIFTVAIISPATTGLKAGNVAKVIDSSTWLRRSTASLSTTRTPGISANKLARPVKARSTCTPPPRTAAAISAAAASSETSPGSMRATTIS